MHAYEQHGTDFVRRLNGIFAFVIWDDRAQRLVAARDAFGVKPLYWWTDGARVAVAGPAADRAKFRGRRHAKRRRGAPPLRVGPSYCARFT